MSTVISSSAALSAVVSPVAGPSESTQLPERSGPLLALDSASRAKHISTSPSATFIPSERYQQLQTHASEASQALDAAAQRSRQSADKILGLFTQQLRRDQADGATAEQLQSRLQAGLEGVQQGFSQAMAELSDMGLMSDELSLELEQTLQQITDRVVELQQGVRQGPVESGKREVGGAENTDASTLKALFAQQFTSQAGLESLLHYLEVTPEATEESTPVISLRV